MSRLERGLEAQALSGREMSSIELGRYDDELRPLTGAIIIATDERREMARRVTVAPTVRMERSATRYCSDCVGG